MKNALLTLSLIPALCCAENTTEVYKSDMTSWEKINAGKGNNWIDWNDAPDGLFQAMTSAEKELSGCDNGIVCKYDSDFDSDAWAISPAVTLDADVNYTVTVFVRDEGDFYSEENWELKTAQGSTIAEITAGISLFDQSGFNNQTLKEYSTTFTPDESGEYNFGIHCFSEADNYGIYATGFTITTNSTTAAALITTDNAATPRYFNTQGIEITNPTAGQFYIVKEGNKIYKTILK